MKGKRLIALFSILILTSCTAVDRRQIPPIDLKGMEMEAFPYKFSVDRIKKYTEDISKEDLFRVPGSIEDKRVLDYVGDFFKNNSIECKEIPFVIDKALIDEKSLVSVKPANEVFKSKGIMGAPSTEEAGIEASGIDGNLDGDLTGKIPILEVENSTDIYSKMEELKKKGAVGALVYSKGSSNGIGSISASKDFKIPARAISEKDALMLKKVVKNNDGVKIYIKSSTKTEKIESKVLLAKIEAKDEDKENLSSNMLEDSKRGIKKGNILLTSYTDSPSDPGASSAAAALASLMELAQLLKNEPLKDDIYIAIISGGEIEGGGTRALINSLSKEEIENNLLTLNLDSFGRSSTICFTTDRDDLKKELEDISKKVLKTKTNFKNYLGEYGKELENAGLKSVNFSVIEDPLKNTISDKAWTIDYSRLSKNFMDLIKIIDYLSIGKL